MIHHHELIDQEERNKTHVGLWPEAARIVVIDRVHFGVIGRVRSATSAMIGIGKG